MEYCNIYDSLDYMSYLRKVLITNKKIYGFKAQLAEAAGCQRSYLSQVISGKADLTPEHAIGIGIFLKLNTDQTEYFMNLVLYARASSKTLKEFLKRKLEATRMDQENLIKRIDETQVFAEAEAAIFYSNWQYLAISILLTIPQFRSVEAIAERLMLKDSVVVKALQDLENLKIVYKAGNEWQPTNETIHIPRDSKFNSLNHSHWRHQAVQNSFVDDRKAVHYTSLYSLSLEDTEEIKKLIFKLIDETRGIVRPSNPEELFCFTCDWFKV